MIDKAKQWRRGPFARADGRRATQRPGIIPREIMASLTLLWRRLSLQPASCVAMMIRGWWPTKIKIRVRSLANPS